MCLHSIYAYQNVMFARARACVYMCVIYNCEDDNDEIFEQLNSYSLSNNPKNVSVIYYIQRINTLSGR